MPNPSAPRSILQFIDTVVLDDRTFHISDYQSSGMTEN